MLGLQQHRSCDTNGLKQHQQQHPPLGEIAGGWCDPDPVAGSLFRIMFILNFTSSLV